MAAASRPALRLPLHRQTARAGGHSHRSAEHIRAERVPGAGNPPDNLWGQTLKIPFFAENARIVVELGARSPRAIIGSDDPYLVKWGNATPPDATTKFSLSVNGEVLSQYRLRADATGLQLGYTPGTLMIVR